MRVLYLSRATHQENLQSTPKDAADFQCDMTFHGLRSLLGPDCVDVNKLTFMYEGEPYPPFFSIYGLLPDIEVDRSDIVYKIRRVYFDYIIYGSIHRYRPHLDLVTEFYPPDRIAFIDGEDDPSVVSEALGHGIYYKRELNRFEHDQRILPIEFAIPKEKVREPLPKTRLMAPCDPRDRSTYIYYGNENAYYNQYGESYFGYTRRKGGWDSCRHYEIMAAGAIPYFENIEGAPLGTLAWLPRQEIKMARSLCDHWGRESESLSVWEELHAKLRANLLTNLTTEALAKRLLGRLMCD